MHKWIVQKFLFHLGFITRDLKYLKSTRNLHVITFGHLVMVGIEKILTLTFVQVHKTNTSIFFFWFKLMGVQCT